MNFLDITKWYAGTDGRVYVNPRTIARVEFGYDYYDKKQCAWISFVDGQCLKLYTTEDEFWNKMEKVR